MADQAGPALTPDTAGWAVLHLFYRVDRARWHGLPAPARASAVAEFQSWLRAAQAEEGLQLIPLAGIAKADVAFMAVHPDVRRVQRLGQELAATAIGACLLPVYSFLSISEVSEYMSTAGDWAKQLIDEQKLDPASAEFAASLKSFTKRMALYADARVHPQLPDDFPILCFYPMTKTRRDTRNWYTLDFGERKRFMGGHATTGRRFADRVTQLITSSIGLDDWEWGVTLFARDLKSLRDVVYEMRFDLGSAIYGEFGSFYVGIRFTPEELAEVLKL
ncbi:MAG: chlorite dismutase family protein [Deltaproteobacteria bacterium]|nr:chlorite dismutase family protein [Deltaproteobacteria bacterium]